MRTEDGNEGHVTIQMKSCPLCKTPIHKASRYLNELFEVLIDLLYRWNVIIKKQLQLVENTKKKLKELEFDAKKARKEAVEVLGLSQGHWFACPNGHPYAIGECGGAMEVSKCPDCGAKVGGARHQIVEGNRLATDMDGATTPAYPTTLIR